MPSPLSFEPNRGDKHRKWKPEQAVKCLVRFVLAQAAVSYGMELMTALFSIAQGMISSIMSASGLSAMATATLPAEMVTIIEDVSFLESIPLWAVTLLGSLFIWGLSLVMILTVYSRFFKLYLATAIAPIPMASFAGQPSSSIGISFLKSYAAIWRGVIGKYFGFRGNGATIRVTPLSTLPGIRGAYPRNCKQYQSSVSVFRWTCPGRRR